MLGRLRALHLTPRLLAGVAGCALLAVASYLWPWLSGLAGLAVAALGVAALVEAVLLVRPAAGVSVDREVPRRFSNGDANEAAIVVENRTGGAVSVSLVEELPVQFQARGYAFRVALAPGERHRVTYTVRPTQRGRYGFGHVNAYVRTALGLVERRYVSTEAHEAAVYPSFLQLERYELVAATQRLDLVGLKKLRRLGHTMEFEHIREYVRGDDVRTLNWRATARRGDLMVNQFQDERAQPIYAVVDTGRAMKLPFDGLTLLDHAINAALVLGGVAVKKGDLAGLVTYSSRVHTVLKADRRAGQVGRLLETLYGVDTDFEESDVQRLYAELRARLPRRSLLVVFTNYESLSGLRRHLGEWRRLAQHHVVLVVLFENPEVRALTQQQPATLDAVYVQTVAQQFVNEKAEIARTLRQHGILTLHTTPAALTLDVVNRYLALKAQGVV